ncbi:MAG: ABC transporter substrate-binding protein [Gammaproteobacteria bacterium]|nr:ABC transporter substrate-binding protein [Gammaproteobacteria bacterium]
MSSSRPRGVAARLIRAGLFFLPALVLAAPLPATPDRIVSLNLCTDSLLLELAPTNVSLSLTRLSRDPRLSPLAAEAARHASNDGLAEQVVAFKPQLVLAASDSSPAIQLLRELGYRVEIFAPANRLADYQRALHRLAGLLGSEQTGVGLWSQLQERLSTLPRLVTPERALMLSGNGYLPDEGSLSRELLATVGLEDARARYVRTAQGTLPLEALVRHPPSWLVAGIAPGGAPSLAGEYLGHPALQAVFADSSRVIPLPEALFTCAGSHFADAAAALSQALVRGGARMQP